VRRREFIAGLGSAAAWPIAARAQQARLPVIEVLHAQSPESYGEQLAALRQGLAEAGYIEGRDVVIKYNWLGGHVDRIPALVPELVRAGPAAIVVLGTTPGALALKAATRTIPIVFLIGPDPVALGLVASLSRPESNLSGVTISNVQVIAKRLELLHQLMASVTSAAFLVNPTNAAATRAELGEMQNAAKALGLGLLVVNASTQAEIETAFATAVAARAGALFVSGESFFTAHNEQIVALAARHRLPTIHQSRSDAVAGGLMSYGANNPNSYRVVGNYVGRILKGAAPPIYRCSRRPKSN
jgi:putative tryptophan/tyrosine transport system substrate-binding protein